MRKLFFLFFATSLFFFSCGNDDETSPQNADQGTMTVTKNGDTFEITEFTNRIIIAEQGGREGRQLSLNCEVDGGSLFVSVSNWDFQNPPVNGIVVKSYPTNEDAFDPGPDTDCIDDPNFTFCDGGEVTYSKDGTTFYSDFLDDDNYRGIITISDNDTDKRTVSGSFDVKIEAFPPTDPVSSISLSGTFSDVKY